MYCSKFRNVLSNPKLENPAYDYVSASLSWIHRSKYNGIKPYQCIHCHKVRWLWVQWQQIQTIYSFKSRNGLPNPKLKNPGYAYFSASLIWIHQSKYNMITSYLCSYKSHSWSQSSLTLDSVSIDPDNLLLEIQKCVVQSKVRESCLCLLSASLS